MPSLVGSEMCIRDRHDTSTRGGGRPASGCGTTGRTMGIEHGMAEAAASDPLPRQDGAGAAYGLYFSHRGGRRGLLIQPDRQRQVATTGVFCGGYPRGPPGRGAATRRRRRSSPPLARQSWQESAAFHGKRSRPGGLRIQARQAPQAHEHLDRTVACYQRRPRARVRSAAHGHSRTARRPWRG